MTGRGAIAGLSLLCVLALCAFAAPSATALEGTTAFTCKPEPKPTELTKGFEDEHCNKAAQGSKVKFIHKEIAEAVKTQLLVTNNETAAKTVTAKLKTTVEKKEFAAQAEAFTTCEGKKTTVANLVFEEEMFTGGIFCGEYTKVTVTEPKNCSVLNNTIKLTDEGIWISEVKENPLTEKVEMWLEFKPPAGKPFATFEITGGKECPLDKKVVELTGTVETTGTFSTSPLDGATLKFNTKTSGETLKAGAEEAKFEGTFTPRMLLEGEGETNPIVLTTTKT